MADKKIYITDSDMKRLLKLVKTAREFNQEDEKYLRDLESELGKASIVKSEDIPNNVITMNAKVLLKDLDSKEELTYQLVFPEDSNPGQDKISVLSPIGTALLGYNEGDNVEWAVPAGTARLKVKKILYQPEAVGKYDS
jgi:regulator of nucleoside diphosphate kinase